MFKSLYRPAVLTCSQSKRRRTTVVKSEQQNGTISGSDSDKPIVAKKSAGRKSTLQLPSGKDPKDTSKEHSSDAETPLLAKLAEKKKRIEEHAVKEAKEIRKAEEASTPSVSAKKGGPGKKKQKKDDSESDEPIAKRKQTSKRVSSVSGKSKKGTAAKSAKVKESDDDEDDDLPLRRKKPAPKSGKTESKSEPAKAVGKSVKGKAKMKEETVEDAEAAEAEEDEYRWWEDPAKGDGSIKWTTLEHAGVVFPPPYEPLPQDVKMRYEGKPVSLKPEAEEVAGFFGAMLNSTHNVENPTFIKNFFGDFQKILQKTGGATDEDGRKVKIEVFSKCDFTPIFDYYEAKRMERKAIPAAEKKKLKAEKDAAEAPYVYCMWDGRKEKVGNFRVEPPGLFRGRGEHPKTGHVKKRVMPEQITVNIGKEAKVPAPPEGHRWKEVKHDQTGTWLVMWQENINNAYKYVMLSANSAIKGQSDYHKFEKARELKVRTAVSPGLFVR